jgi:glycosyltransferase involved in cell wall biosynthesis
MKSRIAIINREFLHPTEIWIRRHIEGLKKNYPIVIVWDRVGKTQHLRFKVGYLLFLNHWRLLTKPLNIIGKYVLKIPSWGYGIFLKVIISVCRISVIHIHFFWNALWVFDYIKSLSVPIIVTAHGTDVNRAFANIDYRNRITSLFDKIDQVICVSHFIKKKLVELGCPQEKLIVNYLGVPIVSIRRDQNRNENGLMRLVCVAAFRPEKGHEILLDVFREVIDECFNCELILVGDGELKEIIKRKAIELSIEEKVKIMGWQDQDNVFKLLANSDIYVQCGRKYVVEGEICKEEGLSISALEAAMIGLPLVLTDVGGVGEVCLNEYNGYLCPCDDVAFVKDRIIELINSNDLRREFGEHGTSLVRSKFNQETNLQALEVIYDGLVKSRKKP